MINAKLLAETFSLSLGELIDRFIFSLGRIAFLEQRVAELEEAQRWRVFPDEKPESGVLLVVKVMLDGETFVDCDKYMDWFWRDYPNHEVKGWTYLPTPPQEQKPCANAQSQQ
jgi:hypothetical protein